MLNEWMYSIINKKLNLDWFQAQKNSNSINTFLLIILKRSFYINNQIFFVVHVTYNLNTSFKKYSVNFFEQNTTTINLEHEFIFVKQGQ